MIHLLDLSTEDSADDQSSSKTSKRSSNSGVLPPSSHGSTDSGRMKSPSVILKSNRNYAEKKKILTSLISKWICQNMRPISIVGDQGFVEVVQQCLMWNDPHFGGKTNDILPSRTAIQREISCQASEIRQSLSVQLIQAAEDGALAISPDLWTDRFRQTSYFGITGHFTNNEYVLSSIDLCCEPYNEVNKRADSVLKRKPMPEKQTVAIDPADQFRQTDHDDESLSDYDDRDSTSSDTDDEVILDAKSGELVLRSLSSSSPESDHVNVPEDKLPTQASQMLITITRCNCVLMSNE
ncbi:unnamed protein product [Didymodactylos carnosus]|uniref:Uncharacterized protein n=1 Tax=Didymodactylos carnosus TaxID=1234261 RepID=A0A815FV31_9BILA|nr:unnamed protein product [Didymodactylos carnosus]CAF1330600.1 unnamed protein product [Didymodactylos carnosus]CAF3975960.1 unnamed protein product [Didymodactylos carnosus]CAF4183987.1 unnamed protein product [Didymodactylos carnosus]